MMVSVLILLILNYFNRGTMMINDRKELQSTILTYSPFDSVGVATLLEID